MFTNGYEFQIDSEINSELVFIYFYLDLVNNGAARLGMYDYKSANMILGSTAYFAHINNPT